MTMKEYAHSCAEELKKLPTQKTVVKVCNKILHLQVDVPSNNMKMIYFIRKVNMPCSEHEICVSCELTFTIKYAILNIYISGKQFFNHSVI